MTSTFNRLRALVVSCAAAAVLLVTASVGTAFAQAVVVSPDQAVAPAYAQAASGQSVYPGVCPVPPEQLAAVLQGYYGVDALYRPVNSAGIPVDVYGNCLADGPVLEIYNYQPSALYVNRLWIGFGIHYSYSPSFVHLYHGSGVRVYSSYGAVPYGHSTVVIQHNYYRNRPIVTAPRAPVVTTPRTPSLSPSVTAPRAPATVAPAVRSTVTPPRSNAPSVFNRAPAAVAPAARSTVTPPRSNAPSVFKSK